MEQFYKLLRYYNSRLHKKGELSTWHQIYTEEEPPSYFKVLAEQLNDVDKNLTVIEVGSGFGDVIALLLHLGFKNIIGFERDPYLCEKANRKLYDLFGINEHYILNEEYPFKLNFIPDVYIQVNNVYVDNLVSKSEYIDRIKTWNYYNGKPIYSFIEMIDASYTGSSRHFPSFVRLTKNEVQEIYSKNEIEVFKTYIYPENSSSKCLYKIVL